MMSKYKVASWKDPEGTSPSKKHECNQFKELIGDLPAFEHGANYEYPVQGPLAYIRVEGRALPIAFCPFCGKNLRNG